MLLFLHLDGVVAEHVHAQHPARVGNPLSITTSRSVQTKTEQTPTQPPPYSRRLSQRCWWVCRGGGERTLMGVNLPFESRD
jgi:hypothetical protein